MINVLQNQPTKTDKQNIMLTVVCSTGQNLTPSNCLHCCDVNRSAISLIHVTPKIIISYVIRLVQRKFTCETTGSHNVIYVFTLCPKKTCDYIFYNNFNNRCPITIIFSIVSSKSMRHRKMVSFPTSPIQCNYLTLGNHRTQK